MARMTDCTWVISRSPGDAALSQEAAERGAFEDALAAALAAEGCPVLLTPHVYHLADGHPALDRLAALDGRLVLAAWLHPRASYWTLRSLGIADEAGAGPDGPEGRIRCLDLAAFPTVEAAAAALRQAGGEVAEKPAAPEEVAAETPTRWYPVIDYSRCVACGKCRDFCLFGVYAVEEGRIVAAEPDACKDGCPACARLCPQGAILFPHYAADPAIAGAPGAALPDGQAQVAAFLDQAQAEKERAECGEERDDLDDLIAALDRLDD